VTFRLTVFFLLAATFCFAAETESAYGALWLYNGSWDVKRSDSKNPDRLVNKCALLGKYFACQQTINGTQGNLLVFIPSNTPGQYRTQNITPSGRATGLAELTIQGNTWTYNSTWDQGGKTTWYKTSNVFSGNNRIHFEQSESTDDRKWATTVTGDETRIGALPPKIIVR
jgi:hypothetical protein